MAEKDEKFIKLIGNGKAAEALAFVKEGYDPSIGTLATALGAALRIADPDGVELAVNWHIADGEGGKRYFQMYGNAYWSEQSGAWKEHGGNAWVELLGSGKGPGDAGFDACAAKIATLGSVNAPMRIDQRDKEVAKKADRLVHHLALRGWLGLAKALSSGKERMDPDGGRDVKGLDRTAPLRLALMSGHGSFAKWLLDQGAKPSEEMFSCALRGVVDPWLPDSGAFAWATEEERLLALRIGAKLDGLQVVDSFAMGKITDDPLASPVALATWLMVKGGRAQGLACIPMERRVELVAKLLAASANAPWEKVLEAKPFGEEPAEAPPKGAFSFFAKGKAEKIKKAQSEMGKYWADAEARVRAKRAPDLRGVLPNLDAGRFSQARQALAAMGAAELMEAAVALLGMAKAGYWDMPMPGGVGDEGRNAPRWAGFKLAIEALAAKGAIDEPIEGLKGIGLVGLASALGHADACAALVEAGARPDPDPLSEAASPLALAIRFGRHAIAESLLAAGASPLEGAKPSAFGFARKPWALHLAIDAKLLDLALAMLEADPRCCSLPDASGRVAYERALVGRSEPGGDADGFHARLMAGAERAGMRAISFGGARPEEGKPEPQVQSREEPKAHAPSRARPEIAASRPKSL